MMYKLTLEEICTYEVKVEADTETRASEMAHAMIEEGVTLGVKLIDYQINTLDIKTPKLSVWLKKEPS